jgi:hypothetical protein
MVQEYAKKVAQKLGKIEFKPSNEWCEIFHNRYQVVFHELCGQSSDVSSETTAGIDNYVQTEPDIMYIDAFVQNHTESRKGRKEVGNDSDRKGKV